MSKYVIRIAIGCNTYLFAFFIFLLAAVSSPVFANTYYVDTQSLGGTCNDANNGTALATPWCTIQKSASTMTAGDTAHIRGGTYRETVTASNSGTVNNPIIYKAYPGETPVINGGDLITNWSSLGAEETGGLFSTGFETGNLNNFNSTTTDAGNTATAQGTVVSKGNYAFESTYGGTNKNARVNKTLIATDDVYGRMYFKVNTNFSLATTSARFDIMLLRLSTTATRAKVSLVQDGSGNLSIQGRLETPAATTFYSGSAGEIQKDTWYYVELRYKGGDAATGGAELWLNGVSKGSNYAQNTSGLQVSRIEIGGNSSSITQPSNGSSLYIDDIKVNTSQVGGFTAAGNDNVYKASSINWTAKTLFEDGTRIGTISATTLGEVTGPNLWYLDTAADSLYVWLPANANPNQQTMEASRRDKVFDITNKSYITLDGLTIQYNRQNTNTAAGIYLSSASNIQVTNSTILDNFGTGVYLIGSTNNTISNNTFLRNMRTFGGGVRLENGSNNNTISNNTITGQGATAGNGIFFCGDDTCNTTGNSYNTITGNTISNVQDTCFYADTNNDFTTIEKNICHDALVDTTDSTKGGNGIHLALGSDDNVVSNNIIYNMQRHGISIRDGNTSQGYVANYRNEIYNNTIYNIGTNGTGNGIDIQGTNPQTIIKNNIAVLLGTGTAPINIESASSDTVTSDYNIFYNTEGSGAIAKWNGTSYTQFVPYQTLSHQDTHSLAVNPQFTDVVSNNFRLSNSSRAIDNGATIDSMRADFTGTTRPQGCAYDIGAYEFAPRVCQVSPSNPGGGAADPNLLPGWQYAITSGPHYVGNVNFISGQAGAEGTASFVGKSASVHDLTVRISKTTLQDLMLQFPRVPFPWEQKINTLGEIYNFQALSAFNGMSINTFDRPVTIVVPYDRTKLKRNQTPNVIMFDAKKRVWKILSKNLVIDRKNHTVSTTVTSFSYITVGYLRK